jgi:hypothetical protein
MKRKKDFDSPKSEEKAETAETREDAEGMKYA